MTTHDYNTDPVEKLYNVVKSKGYYTKSLDDFKKQYSSPEAVDNLYGIISTKKLYTKSKDDFYNQYFNSVKKKESGGAELPSAAPSQSVSATPSITNIDVDKLRSFVTGKPIEQVKAEKQEKMKPPAQITTAITQVKDTKPTEESVLKEAERKIDMLSDEDMADPIKGINKLSQANPTNPKDILATEKAKKLLEERIAPDGFEAKQKYERTMFGAGGDNQTSQILRQKAERYDKNVAPLRELVVDVDLSQANDLFIDYNYKDKIYSAAVQSYAEKYPHFKKELEAAGINPKDFVNVRNQIPDGKMGRIMEEYLSDPDVYSFLQKENPSLLPAFQHVQKNLLKDNENYAINVVANKVSKAVQETGFNNIDPVFNFYGENHKQFADQIANQVLSPEELEVWNKNIRDNQEKYMDAPSLFQGIAEGGGDVFKGIGNTFTEPFRSVSESTKRRWEKEASHVSADPQGIFKVMRDTGHVLGLVGAIAGTGNVLGAGGTSVYSSKIVPALSGGVLPFMGDMLEQGRAKYPDSPVKAWTSALVNTSMYAALSQSIFPAKSINQAIRRVEPEVNGIVERLASGEITREAARQQANTIFKQAFDFAKGTVGKAAKITGELEAIKAFDRGLDKIMMDDEQTYESFHPTEKASEDAIGLFLSNLALGAFTKFGDMKKRNRIAEESYYELASNPNKYERMIDNLSVDKSFGTIQEFKENLRHISNVKKELDALKIHPKDQKRFIFESLKEKAAKEQAENSADPTIQQRSKDVIKNAKEVKEKILQGEDAETVVTESQRKELEKQRETELKIERLTKDNELENKRLDKLRDGLDGRNPDDKLKIEKIEEDRRRVNEDFKLELEKLKPTPTLPGVYGEMFKENPEAVLKDIAEQAQGVDSSGNPLPGGSRTKDMIEQGFPKEIIEEAVRKYPVEPKSQSSISVIRPEEVKQPTETITIKPKEDAVQKQVTDEVDVRQQAGDGEAMGKGDTKPQEPTGEKETSKGEGKEEVTEPNGEGDMTGITHAQMNELSNEFGFPTYEKDPQTQKEWMAEAEKRISQDQNAINDLMNKMRRGDMPSPVEQKMMLIYIAGLRAKVRKTPTPELLRELNRAKDISNIVGGRFVGQSLAARKGERPTEDTLDSYLSEWTESYGTETLPKEKITELKERFEKEQELKAKVDEAYRKGREDALNEQAQEALNKHTQSKGSRQKKDYKKEREALREELKKAADEHREWLKKQGIHTASMGGFSLTSKEAIIISKIAKSYAEQGVKKLGDVLEKVYEEVKDVLPQVTKRDIRDVIAGVYSEKKETRNELAESIINLKREAKLLNEIENELKGIEKEKNVNKKIKKTARIEELEKRLKELQKRNKENKKSDTEEPVEDISAGDIDQISDFKKKRLKQIENFRKRLRERDYSEPPKPPKRITLDAEAKRLQDEYLKMKEEDMYQQELARYKNLSTTTRTIDTARKWLGIKRVIQTAIDTSIPFRQNVAVTMNPLKWVPKYENGQWKASTNWKQFKNTFTFMFSPRKMREYMNELKESGEYYEMVEDGITFSDPTEMQLSKREEDFRDNIFQDLRRLRGKDNPVGNVASYIGEPIFASERAAAGALNTVRVELWRTYKRNLERQGITRKNSPEHYQKMAEWVMNMTGRGKMLKMIEDSKYGKQFMGDTMYGARLFASRFNLLRNPIFAKMPMAVRKEVFKDMAGFISGITVTGLALAAAGGKISFNPNDPDFLQVRFGDKTYDLTGGLAAYIRTFLRLTTAAYKQGQAVADKSKRKEANKYSSFAMRTGTTFFTNKLAPNTAYGYHFFTGKSPGEDGFDPYEFFEFYPMYVDDLKDGWAQQGPTAIPTILLPNLFGIGVQTYEKPRKSRKND